jgi:hypothetical protein
MDTDFSVREWEQSDSLVRLLRRSYAKDAAMIIEEAH